MSTHIHSLTLSKFSSTDGWDDMYEEHMEYEKELEEAAKPNKNRP